jgi:hypothetical protein
MQLSRALTNTAWKEAACPKDNHVLPANGHEIVQRRGKQEFVPTEPYLYHQPRNLADSPSPIGQIPEGEE